ncbi:winged helix-turn-helix domain-containing protein [Enterococcus sp. AZ163]|uniref:winged helix-turn-helix domain-containing protein n=1 Tax=Enterococcus sp. AZ163 TaxID=2774638 RepID=UPI003D2DDBD9
MSRILMLTKCQYAEENLERMIRRLGHELFCTTSILDAIKYGKPSSEFLEQFQIILLSETISNKECLEIIGRLDENQFVFIQLSGKVLSKDEQERKGSEGITHCLSTSASLEMFREVLSQQPKGKTKEIFSLSANGTYLPEDLIEKLALTKMERRVFQLLIDSEGQTVSRENLCREIWKVEPSQSTQSQLSTLIRKIKVKMSKTGINSGCIKTQWGLGYMLDMNVLRSGSTIDHSVLYQAQ